MTYTTGNAAPPASRSADGDREVYADEETGMGWLFFAGTMLGLAGLMRIIDAIWAFGASDQAVNLKDGVLGDNLTTYAWLWLILGLILIVSSFYVLVRSQFARWVGIVAAGIGALGAMTWMPYTAVWSFTYISLAVLTIYALGAHGGREPR